MGQPAKLPDDQPMTLAEACEGFFRGTISIATLRAEAKRGRLTIMRIGRMDFVTPAGLREMMEKCRVQQRGHASTFTPSNEPGSSETDRLLAAQAAMNSIATALKKGSPPTSRKSSSPSPMNIIPLGSMSQKS